MGVVELSYTEVGVGRPVVLLHAFPLSSQLFAALLPLPGYRVITPDLRGFGSSPGGDDEPDLAHMAEDVRALMDRLGLAEAVLGGVSMGGYVVMEMLRQEPELVTGALLIDTKATADSVDASAGRLAMAEAVLERGRPVLEPMIDALLGSTSLASRPDVVGKVSEWLDQADPAAVAWAQRAMAVRPDSHPTLAAAQVPIVAMVGEQDTLSPPSDAESMSAAARAGRVLVVPEAGHLAVFENPAPARSQLLVALDLMSS
jgi:pimeloyl-ACP methyl ester carboxylesterase